MGLLNSSPCLTNQKWGFNMGLTNRGNILCVQFLQSFLSSTCQAAALSMAQAAHSWHSLEGEGLEESLSLTICTFNVLCERFEKKILKDGWQLEVENRNGTCLLTEGVCFKCNECSGINSLFPLCLILTYSCRAWQNGCCRFDPRRVVWIERLKHTSNCSCFPLKSWHIFESGDKLGAPSPFFSATHPKDGQIEEWKWEERKDSLVAEILRCEADIVCLQEVPGFVEGNFVGSPPNFVPSYRV